jgi:hypothetical protein
VPLVAATLMVVVAIVIVGLLAFGGTTNAPTSTSSTTGPSNTTSTTTAIVPAYSIKRNARTAVTTSSCVHGANQWTFSGSIRNASSSAKRYAVVIDFVRTATAAVVDTKVITVARLGAGRAHPWTVSGASGYSGLDCVVRFAEAWPAS